MRLIPVLDLAGGVAVHARRGQRERYRPVQSRLAQGTADPLALGQAYRALGFTSVYVADLDAIAGRGDHRAVVARLQQETGLAVLLDAGVRTTAQCAALASVGVVAGSETLGSLAELAAMVLLVGPERLLFSLDLREGRVVAASPDLAGMTPLQALAEAAGCGITQAVVLDLDAVGSEAGPDLALVAAAREAVPGCAVWAGGGVRGEADLEALARVGAAGSLVATALHTGALPPEAVWRWV